MGTVLGEGNDTTFILATIHGDEPAGTPLVRRLTGHLRQHPDLLRDRTVVILPVANPDGMAMNRRANANGVDLNRNFRTANRTNNPQFGTTALSEPEARAITRIITQYTPDRIVSVHQPLACVDYDGPAQTLADRMAQQCGLPVRKLGAKPGSLGSYAGLTLGTPIVTLELPQGASRMNQQQLWQQYGKALLAAIVYPERL
jgi:protein MpaA